MNILAILKVALRALNRNKVRTLLTTLGIIVGIAAVIAVMAVGKGASTMIHDQIQSMGNNMVMIFPGSSHGGGVQMGLGGVKTLTNDDGEALLKESQYVKTFTPIVMAGAQLVYQENNWSTRVTGTNQNYPEVRSWPVEEGDFFTDADVRISSRVCLIGHTVIKQLFAGEDPVGKSIRIKNMSFRVIGVMASKGTAAWGQDQDDIVVAPWTTVRHVLQNSPFNDVNLLSLSLFSMDRLDAAKDEIGTILRERHHLAPGAEDDFNTMDMTEVTNTIGQIAKIMTALLEVVASISLIVGGIGIMNIMLVSVTERTREIGLRMAIGARRNDILRQFLVEAVVLSSIGGVLGVALGSTAALLVSKVMKWPILVSPFYIMLALAFAGGVGIFFGFYPAWRASKLDPIDALRHE